MRDAGAALARIRQYLDEVMYSLVDLRLSFEAPVGPNGFPKFESLRGVVARLDASHATLFRLLRLGEPVEQATAERAIPRAVLDAFADTGLLTRDEGGGWRTPSLLLVPLDGVMVFVSTPAAYPTATRPASVWFDLSSYVVARSLPGSLTGEKVLDICSGSGVQSILCAKRAAQSAVGLDISEEAVALSRLNASLNGVGERIDFRVSNKLDALGDDERADFVVCNTPYAPVTGDETPERLEALGNRVLLDILDLLPAHLSARGCGILAAWRCAGINGRILQRELIRSRLSKAGLSTLTFADRAPDTPEGVLRICQNDAEQRLGPERAAEVVEGVGAMLRAPGAVPDGFYNLLIHFKSGSIEAALDTDLFRLAAPTAA